jgi:hypothetical protein
MSLLHWKQSLFKVSFFIPLPNASPVFQKSLAGLLEKVPE